MKSIAAKWSIICSIIAGITILGICYMIFIIAPKRKQEAEKERIAVLVKQEQIRQERIQRLIGKTEQRIQEIKLEQEESDRKHKQERELEDKKRELELQENIKKRQKEKQEELAKQQNELAKWKQFKIGMSKTQVENILGKPTSLNTFDLAKQENWGYRHPEGFYNGGRIEFKDGKLSSWDAPRFRNW